MVDASSIGWGSYSLYEGPFYWGKRKWTGAKAGDFLDESILVLSATEGNLDAVNMYDVCICTVGTIQFCDAYPQQSVTRMLGFVKQRHPDPGFVDRVLATSLKASNAELKLQSPGKWNFYIDGKPVASRVDQRKLYFAGCSGQKGQWTPAQKAHARQWAASLATVFEDKDAQDLQIEFTKARLMSFVLPYAKSILFDDSDPKLVGADTVWVKTLRNAYISFAANNPTWASNSIKIAVTKSKHPKWSPGFVIDCLRELTFSRGVKIYPARYNAIRPVLEKLYSVDLPNSANALSGFSYAAASNGLFASAAGMQQALTDLGFDTQGVDGVVGKLTRAAVRAFKEKFAAKYSLTVDETVDAKTVAAIAAEEVIRRQKALDEKNGAGVATPKPEPEPKPEPKPKKKEQVIAEPKNGPVIVTSVPDTDPLSQVKEKEPCANCGKVLGYFVQLIDIVKNAMTSKK